MSIDAQSAPSRVTVLPADGAEPEISFGTAWRFLHRHSVLLGVLTVVGAVAFGVAALLHMPQYTAFASFIPEGKNTTSQLSGLAAQFGIGGLPGDGSQSPQFFADLVTSPTVLRDVVTARYTATGDSTAPPVSLVSALGAHGDTEAQRIADAMNRLKKRIEVSVSPKTGLISVNVRARSAPLALQIAQRVLDEVNLVNLRLRQSQATGERQFAEARVEELATELRAAEDRLQNFMQTNRDYRLSPRLSLEEQRLARDVSMRQQVYSTMAQAYEQDRIESARDNPVINVVDYPTLPPGADPRGVLKMALGGVLIGLFAAVLGGLVMDVSRSLRGSAQARRV